MTSRKFDKLFGGPPRRPESEITQREMDLAASVQAVTEEVMLRMSHHVHAVTGMNNLVLAGGVALNCVGNGRILREGPFNNLWIQPAGGDAGGALGTALYIWHQLLEKPRVSGGSDLQSGSLLGPEFSEDQIVEVLDRHQATYDRCDSSEQLCDRVACLVADQNVVGWFQGRMEFGPRALGSRSILGDARSPEMQSVMNHKIKFRESFRPFAPIVMREHASRFFQIDKDTESPYMSLVVPVQDQIRTDGDSPLSGKVGFEKLNQCRSNLPAVTHVDGSARVQTVDRERHPLLHQLLSRLYEKTDCAVMINTSFNVRGEPIVCTPEDAYQCFVMTEMDALVLGKHLLIKSDQVQLHDTSQREEHLAQFAQD